jgi:hypothetical protein
MKLEIFILIKSMKNNISSHNCLFLYKNTIYCFLFIKQNKMLILYSVIKIFSRPNVTFFISIYIMKLKEWGDAYVQRIGSC